MEDREETVEMRILTEAERSERRDYKSKICELENFAKIDIQQKAKIRWLTDGDENTRFFHNMIKNKNLKNRLCGLLINGEWCTEPADIKQEAFQFFANKFYENW